ncbi:hypothetical protein vBSauS24_127 [Staphylococcus phage vB_Sau_S24]|nr:hypothetical protein vBSauS24_127 [Staphylococcus phage vB_Sau_S24]
MKFHLNSNIVEGTPEELVEYLRLLEAESTENDKDKDEGEEVYNDVYDKGAFYTVTDEAEDSALPVGAILQHQHGRMFRDSQGNLCIISRPSLLNRGHVNGDEIKKQRFELAKQLGIQLTTTIDFAEEAKGKYFKVTKKYSHLDVGDLVTIDYDEEDTQPLCRDKYGNSLYVCIHDLELLEDAPMGYTFWYIDGVYNRTNNVLEATLDGDFEDSTGTRYTYQAVHGLIKPLDKEDARKHFEEAKHYDCLLKYYSTVDEFTMSKY